MDQTEHFLTRMKKLMLVAVLIADYVGYVMNLRHQSSLLTSLSISESDLELG